MLAPAPPLEPSGAEGRSLLRAELLKKEYHDQQLWQRLLAWLGRLFDRTAGAASGSSPATVFLTMLLAVLLVVGLALLLARVRRDRRAVPTRDPSVLPDRRPSAASLRRSALEALADERYDDAVLDAFRALTARQMEQGALEDQPGLTAHEVSLRLAASQPRLADPVSRGADLFDATLYGHRPATRDEAVTILALDDTLVGVR
jgi:hypothetical protein